MNRALVPILLAAGCVPDAPETPSFQQDVLPILAANCVRCHGYPRLAGPTDMRLDSYSTTAGVIGAAGYARLVVDRIGDDARPMPPRFPLADHQIATLENWVGDLPLGEPPPRGAPRPDNLPPAIRIELVERAGAIVTLGYELRDPDGDLVGGELHAITGADDRIIGALHSGIDTLTWDTTGLAGLATLYVIADDGGDAFRLEVSDAVDLGPP